MNDDQKPALRPQQSHFRRLATPSPWIEGQPHRLTPTPDLTIWTVDTAAGSRKTRKAIPWAIRRAALHDERYLISFPTRLLVEQQIVQAKEEGEIFGIDVRGVLALEQEEELVLTANKKNSSLAVKSAVKTLRQWMGVTGELTPDQMPAVILCTHRAMRLLDLKHPVNWHVIMDEVFDPIETPPLKLTDNIGLLTTRFSLSSGVLDGYYYLRERASTTFHTLERVELFQDSDDAHKLMMQVVEPYHAKAAIFAPAGAWNKTVNLVPDDADLNSDLDPERRTKKGVLHLAVLHTPMFCSMFASFTIMSAALGNTLLFKAWSHRYNVNWIPHPEIKGDFDKHDASGRVVEILYFNEHLLTKSQRDKWEIRYREAHPHSPSKTLIQAMIEIAEKEFDLDDIQPIEGSSRKAAYLFVANLDVRDRDLPTNPSRLRMPNVSHGMNTWRNVNQILFTSALNPDSMTLRFMKLACRMTEEEIHTCWNRLTAYQAALRTSARNDALTDEQRERTLRIAVPDRGTAEWLADWFVNCESGGGPRVRRIGDLVWDPPGEAGRPPLGQQAMSSTERGRRHVANLSDEDKAARKAQKAEAARVRRAREREIKLKNDANTNEN